MHIKTKTKHTAEPIAVIGVSCRFPGAPDLPAFTRLLADGTDAVTEIPADRWSRESYLHTDPRQRGKSYTMAAGVIDQVDRFDAAFFGISPREATQMDPQQRLLLELTHEAFEDAGLSSRRMAATRTGVYVGGSSSDYLALRLGDPAIADAYFMTGATLSTLANRISYIFDFKGPSFTVDTACSSSLVALHLACTAMRRNEVDFAVVGGVNLLLAPQSYVGFSRASMLSPRGRCHAFAKGGDGYVRAEGGGILLLKPLDAAIADGDTIRCVIEGTGINSDGRTTGLSLPSRTAQAALLRDVYGESRVDPTDLVYVEAHGTGTAVGDPIEAAALGEVLGRNRTTPLPIGSVKSNIGHLEAGSGIAGLLKAMIVLRDGTIPASLHSEVLNPDIDFAALNLVVAQTPMRTRPARGRPAVTAVNSFGFGGTNAHAVLSAPPKPAPDPAPLATPAALPPLLVSARSEPALTELAQSWRNRLEGLAPSEAAPLLRAAARGREQHAHRLVATGATTESLVAALDAHAARQPSPDLAHGTALRGATVAFIYSGNGCQWAGMALDALQDPTFRRALEEADAELQPRLGWSVIDRLATVDAPTMRRTDVAQPLLFAVQAASIRALAAAGVTAYAHLGHSVGEVAAAMASGALTLADAAQVIVARSVAQQRTANTVGMAVLAAGVDDAQALLDLVPEIEVAAVNSATSITVAGPRPALKRLERHAARRRVHYVLLDLDYGFHSAAMDPVRATLLQDLEGIAPTRTTTPFYSTVFGQAQDGTGLGPEYWWRNVRAPVRFADALAAAIADGHTILIEVGPNPVLQSYCRDALRRADVPGRTLTTLARKLQDGAPFARIAAHAHVAGHDITDTPVFDGPAATDELPRYPWQRERYWYERTDEATDTIAARSDHPLLGFRRGTEPTTWFNTLDTAAHPWLADHAIDGAALLPAAAMVDIALAAARARHPDATNLDVLDLEIVRPLLLEHDAARETRFTVTGDRGVFEYASRARLSGEAWTVHATGRLGAGSAAPLPAPGIEHPPTHDLHSDELYSLTARLGLDYGPAFQTVTRVSVHGGLDAIVHLAPDTAQRDNAGYLVDPARLDGALQGLVALGAGQLGETAALLPWRIGRVRLVPTTGADSSPAGTQIAAAQLRMTRVGPRSISAEIALLDATGAVVASLADCWFTRVPSAAPENLASFSTHTTTIPSPRDPAAIPAPTFHAVSHHPVPARAPTPPDEAALLMDAFIATAAYAAIATAADGEPINPATLAAAGRIHPDSRPILQAMLGWLERDGLARCTSGDWTLAGVEDLPPAAEIWRSILADAPTVVAEAALAGVLAEALPEILARGPTALPAGLAPLTSHMLAASPAARAATDALVDAIAGIAAAWPAARPLRVLELGAADEAVTARIAAVLARSGATVSYVAALAPGVDATAFATALAPIPGAEAAPHLPGAPMAGNVPDATVDLAIGLLALTRIGTAAHAETLARLQAAMAPGGTVLLAEPTPNRAWDLRFGTDPGWWRAETADTPLQDAAGWLATLHATGFVDAAATPIPGTVWSAQLLSAQTYAQPKGAAQPAQAPLSQTSAETALLLAATPGDPLAEALAETMLAQGRASLAVPFEALAETLRAAPPAEGDVVVIVPARNGDPQPVIAATGATLAAAATALAETTGLRLWCVTAPGTASSAEDAAQLAAALRAVTRVVANEAPNLRPYAIDIAPGTSPDQAASLIAAELAAPGSDTEIALAPNSRRVTRLRHGPGAHPPAATRGAARLAIGRPGLLDTLHWQPMDIPSPGPNQVAIAVAASGLNFRDVMWSLGLLPDEALLDGLAGATLGLECAGTVTATGPGVDHVAVGDRVMAIAPASLATHVVAPAQAVVRLPGHVGFAAGATVPVAFLTVCYALGTLANIQPGERVLIHGGAGGVGLAAIQYARHRGAEIFASAGSPAKRALLRLLGVDHVLDSRSIAFADDIMAATSNQGVDVVLNSLAGEAMERSVGVLRPFGRFLELGKRDLYGNTPLGLRALRHNVSYFAIDADQLPVQRPDVARRVFAEIADLMEQGALRPLPHRPFRFGAATDAFRLMQAAGHIGKIVLEPEPEGPPVVHSGTPWAPGHEGTYVVTGGLGGFGLQTARWLADHGVRSLALLGRRGAATPDAAAAIAALATQGVMARAFAVDVADEQALATTLDDIRASMLPITGIVHAAVVLDDSLLPQLDQARFAHVLAPKLGGARALDRLTRQDPIETFLLYSSITTVLGNPGQANYVAANAGLEALAATRRAQGLPAMSIGWGPIGDVGTLARDQAVSDMLAQRLGHAHMTSAQALALLPALLASPLPHVDVGHVRWASLRQHLPHLATPMFADALRGLKVEGGQVDLARILAESTPEEARTLVGEILAEEVSAITKAPAQQIDLNRSLTDLGMDSLMAVELRMALERRFGANLPLLSLADGASVGAIAARIVRQLTAGTPEAQNTAITSLIARYEDDTPTPDHDAAPAGLDPATPATLNFDPADPASVPHPPLTLEGATPHE